MSEKSLLIGADVTTVFHLFPLKYQWAWDMFLAANQNHWTPNEIPMGPDVGDWKDANLPIALRVRFELVFAQLTTFDIQRGIDIGETLLPLISAPEIKMFLLRQAYEESLHTWAYQYVIENTGMDESRIYTMYQNVPELAARVEYATKYSNLMASVTEESLGTMQGQQNMLQSLIFWYCIFEGIWFALNLAGPVQAMARYYRRFNASSEQFQYILRDESLHINFGIQLINAFIVEHPYVWTPEFERKIRVMFHDCAELERAFITKACEHQSPDYLIQDHMEMVYWYSNLRANAIGIEGEIFPNAHCVMTWMHEMVGSKREKNFFETRVTEYQRGSINFDDIGGGMDLDPIY